MDEVRVIVPSWLVANDHPSGEPPGISMFDGDARERYIYALVDPRTGEPRYIGKSIRPEERLSNHMQDRSSCHRVHWLSQLRALGLKPELVILEASAGCWPWQESERYWIEYGRSHGWDLTNNTDGGDGVSGLPEETRARMAAVWKGRKHSPETIEKLRAARRLRVTTDATKAKMSASQKGRKIEWIGKIADALRKLSAADVECIKRRLAAGERGKDLAAEYGVHRTTISKVKTGVYHVDH